MNHLDIAPRHAGAIFGLGNTFATMAGLVSTPLTGAPTLVSCLVLFFGLGIGKLVGLNSVFLFCFFGWHAESIFLDVVNIPVCFSARGSE